jgi:hypothetical protein
MVDIKLKSSSSDVGAKEASSGSKQRPPAPLEPPALSPDRVIVLGTGLILLGMAGFYMIPGLIKEDAEGSRAIAAFYCRSVSAVRFILHRNQIILVLKLCSCDLRLP